MPTSIDSHLPRRLLGVWPHPDDEAYLSAGLMARVVEQGGAVTVLTLTRGEKGTSEPSDYDRPHFAAHRERELRASLAELGVHDLRLGTYQDGECDLVDPEEAIAAIGAVIRAVDPDAVVTFGPDGITGHPDHRIVSAWVTEAWRRTGSASLRYATMSDEFVAAHAGLHDRIGLFDGLADGPASVPADRIADAIHLSDRELDRKRRALARHASQTAALAALIGESTYRSWWCTEWFRRPTDLEISSCARVAPRVHPVVGVPA